MHSVSKNDNHTTIVEDEPSSETYQPCHHPTLRQCSTQALQALKLPSCGSNQFSCVLTVSRFKISSTFRQTIKHTPRFQATSPALRQEGDESHESRQELILRMSTFHCTCLMSYDSYDPIILRYLIWLTDCIGRAVFMLQSIVVSILSTCCWILSSTQRVTFVGFSKRWKI